ncbi:hypothetical protein [Jeotgalibacillus salarius]|uniref:Uncharacterized protein n=1 Tax=Jeotgalibacillus salarius TaxID=546023 RepID=A0A4Y8LRH6_9BACL|nr:hypothetical protein [Jeotgalibacillus salarius]TFE04059.1 hypothetical protein E2626_01650 [Jeotgalibacillus salarius]
MRHHEPDLKEALDNFDRLMTKIRDENNEIATIKNFLKNFLRIRTTSINLPTSEIMSVIKNEKPSIFYLLKKRSYGDPTFEFLTGINMDYQIATQNLSDIKQQIN